MRQSFLLSALVLLSVSLGCTNNSIPLPESTSKVDTTQSADILGGRNKSMRLELRDENMLEANRLHELDGSGKLVKAQITCKDGAAITCRYQGGNLASAEEIRNDGARIVYTMTDGDGENPILKEELYLRNFLRAVRKASPHDQRSTSTYAVSGQPRSITQNPATSETNYYSEDGKSLICTEAKESNSTVASSATTFYAPGTNDVFATVKFGPDINEETTVYKNGKVKATQVLGSGGPMGTEVFVSVFRADNTLHYTQKWNQYMECELADDGGQLVLAEEYAADGKTVVRRISDIPDKAYDYAGTSEMVYFKSVSLNAAGKELSVRYLRANGTIIREDLYDEAGQIRAAAWHTDHEQVKEISEGLVLTDYKSCPELGEVKQFASQIADIRSQVENNHRRNVLCK